MKAEAILLASQDSSGSFFCAYLSPSSRDKLGAIITLNLCSSHQRITFSTVSAPGLFVLWPKWYRRVIQLPLFIVVSSVMGEARKLSGSQQGAQATLLTLSLTGCAALGCIPLSKSGRNKSACLIKYEVYMRQFANSTWQNHWHPLNTQ